MRVTLNKGNLEIDVYAMLESIAPDDKRALADSIACDSDVIDLVSQQIIGRWTEFGSHGSTGCYAPAEPRAGLDRAWREVAKASGDVAKREIERLEESLKRSNELCQKQSNELHELRHPSYRL